MPLISNQFIDKKGKTPEKALRKYYYFHRTPQFQLSVADNKQLQNVVSYKAALLCFTQCWLGSLIEVRGPVSKIIHSHAGYLVLAGGSSAHGSVQEAAWASSQYGGQVP